MIRAFSLILIVILFNNCSFDNKSGFWTQEKKLNADNLKNSKEKILFEKQDYLENEFNSELRIEFYKENSTENLLLGNNDKFSDVTLDFSKFSKFKFKKINYSGSFFPEIIFHNNEIIFFDKFGTIIKFDENSKIIWKKNFYNKNEKKSLPILKLTKFNNSLLVTDSLSKIYLINLLDGNLLWSTEHQSSFVSQVKIDNNRFYALDSNNTFNCFSLVNGEKIWDFKNETNLMNSQKEKSIVLDDVSVIFNNNKGDIIALDKLSGSLIWISPVISYNESFRSFLINFSDIVLDDKNIYFSHSEGKLYSLSATNGLINWSQQIDSYLRPKIINNFIVTISENGYLYIIEKKSGNILRITNLLENLKEKKRKKYKPSGFIITEDKIYVSTINGHLIVTDIASGKKVSSFKITGDKISKPYVNDNKLYFIKDDQIIKLN